MTALLSKNKTSLENYLESNRALLIKECDIVNKVDLPHKKRLTRKSKSTKCTQYYICEICQEESTDQFSFYIHLKNHYEVKAVVKEDVMRLNFTEHKTQKKNLFDYGTSDSKSKFNQLHNSEFEYDSEDMLENKLQRTVDRDFDTNSCNLNNIFDSPIKEDVELEHNSIPTKNIEEIQNHFVIYMERPDFENEMTEKDNEAQYQIIADPLISLRNINISEVEEPVNKYNETDESQLIYTANNLNRNIMQSSIGTLPNIEKQDNFNYKKKRKYKCPLLHCDKTFKSRTATLYHKLTITGEKAHQCDICGKSFITNSALKVHLRLHTGEKPYPCETCGRKFRQWGDLRYHIQSIHTTEKMHQCEFCGKEFARRYSLVVHRRIHTGEKNYKCDFCEKSFRASSYLQNHRKIHTGEKNHACSVCNKKFRCRGDMKRHLLIHKRKQNGIKSSNGKSLQLLGIENFINKTLVSIVK